ncbi:MAG: hypothetical protein C4520_11195 [Candidatus Abyssobacteria bacterium SURF_5]|uniref:Uncharacterized protein n=1 Tax=Abyssobacteria bacterium (strain SURF_5) TaxID=2093360 RepID=A0A3A4NY49_ABYX5|nr:MAG: hypothetical protein C4520_11195 [Candidatus Abyssubacteria bacterium SURF_5]
MCNPPVDCRGKQTSSTAALPAWAAESVKLQMLRISFVIHSIMRAQIGKLVQQGRMKIKVMVESS